MSLKQIKGRRKRPYYHRRGQYLLTSSFRESVNWHRINEVGVLMKHCTQEQIAYALNTSVYLVGKMVRIYEASK